MVRKKIRNIKVYSYDDAFTLKRINDLSQADAGVVFWFEAKSVDDDFLRFAEKCIELCKSKGIDNYKFSIVTYDVKSKVAEIKRTTRVLKTEELERLILLEEMLSQGAELSIAEDHNGKLYEFLLNDAIQAHEFINAEVEYIKSLSLSPFEQYLMAYEATANLFYNEDPDESKWYQKSRLLISALTQDTFVCVAHAKVFNGLLSGLGFDSQTQSVMVNIDNNQRKYELHVNVLVNLVDPAYGFDGVVFTDACNDSNSVVKTTAKNGQVLYSAGLASMLLSAVTLEDVNKMKGSYIFEKYNLLKALYQDKKLLSSNRYGEIFDCFEDEYSKAYTDFLSRVYPEFTQKLDCLKDIDVNLIEKIQSQCSPKVCKMMVDEFGDIEFATEIEKKGKSNIDCSLVTYDGGKLTKLFDQSVVMMLCGIDDNAVKKYIAGRKPEIMENIENFDKAYEVQKAVKHNQVIAGRYGEVIGETSVVLLSDYLSAYHDFCNDNYAVYAYQMFSRRKEIEELFEMARENSPVVEEDDYLQAYINILKAQGYSVDKIPRYIINKFFESAKLASYWFEPTASNVFSRFAVRQWKELDELQKQRQ